MKLEKTTVLQPTKNRHEFVAQVLSDGIVNPNTPIDLYDSIYERVKTMSDYLQLIDKVVESNSRFICCSANTHINYSCDIGYKQTKEKYDHINNRTVSETTTRWVPHSGHSSSSQTILIDTKTNSYDKFATESFLSEDKATSCEKPTSIDIDDFTLKNLTQKACTERCFSEVSLPGDEHRNLTYSGTVDITSVSSVDMKKYTMFFSYGGKVYSACGYANGKPLDSKNKPIVNAEYPDDSKQLKKEIQQRKFQLLLRFIIPIVAIFFSMILLASIIPNIGLLVVPVGAVLISVGIGVCIAKIGKVKDSVIKKRRKIKTEKLNSFLDKLKDLEKETPTYQNKT